MTKKQLIKFIKEQILVDEITYYQGVFTARDSYFYRHGRTANGFKDGILDQLKKILPDGCAFKIVDFGDHWASFKGGASIKASSHFWVKFKVEIVVS